MIQYALDINNLIGWLLPASVRKPSQLAWLNVLLAPVKVLHQRFLMYATDARFHIKITGQKRILQFHLNRVFDPISNLIYITDSDSATTVFVFLESENRPIYLPTFISGTATDFVVHLPNNLESQETAIRGFLNKYKLVTKYYELRFDIIVL